MNQGQKKSHSLAEAIFNVVIGFIISMVANLIVLPWFGFYVTFGQAFGIGLIFTVISIVRSYVLRRIFNRIMLMPQFNKPEVRWHHNIGSKMDHRA